MLVSALLRFVCLDEVAAESVFDLQENCAGAYSISLLWHYQRDSLSFSFLQSLFLEIMPESQNKLGRLVAGFAKGYINTSRELIRFNIALLLNLFLKPLECHLNARYVHPGCSTSSCSQVKINWIRKPVGLAGQHY